MNETEPQPLPSIDRIADLQQLIAEFACVYRMPNLANKGRKESDVEHSFGLALTCMYLAPKVAPDLNMERILKYALVHDVPELYAGDTFAFDDQDVLTKDSREQSSIDQISEEWRDFPELIEYIVGYKNMVDEEAVFVYFVDKILPSIMVNLGEKDVFWDRHKITRDMHENEKNKKMTVSELGRQYAVLLNEWMADPDYFHKTK